ncbi:hypothetical protein ABEV55_17425 [Aneurinibacillus thermoaerophilus]|uniref:hypothetical protein n=1 Tax=Aneurinibacillus thermoaerophilus TaxID=143495 RepID=UPI002E1C1B7F|nr:hypothetical protein [Aneurinibacillus thermoaerophilus]
MAKPRNDGLLADKLKRLTQTRKLYVLHKFKLFSDDRINWTDEDFLQAAHLQSLKSMREWETTDEFQEIAKIAIASKSANDLWDVYQAMRDKALMGDKNAADMLLKLHKQLQGELRSGGKKQEQEDDGLQL